MLACGNLFLAGLGRQEVFLFVPKHKWEVGFLISGTAELRCFVKTSSAEPLCVCCFLLRRNKRTLPTDSAAQTYPSETSHISLKLFLSPPSTYTDRNTPAQTHTKAHTCTLAHTLHPLHPPSHYLEAWSLIKRLLFGKCAESLPALNSWRLPFDHV